MASGNHSTPVLFTCTSLEAIIKGCIAPPPQHIFGEIVCPRAANTSVLETVNYLFTTQKMHRQYYEGRDGLRDVRRNCKHSALIVGNITCAQYVSGRHSVIIVINLITSAQRVDTKDSNSPNASIHLPTTSPLVAAICVRLTHNMSSLLEMAEQLKDSFSSGLLVFWPAAWSLTLVAMESRMAPAEYARQLGIFLLQTTIGYNLGNAWEEIGAYYLRSGLTRTEQPSEENTHGMSAIIALSELLIFSTFVWSLNTYAFWNALLCLVVISAISPLMKRVSYRSSVVLSLAMNWFLVVAWVANHNVDWIVLTTLFLTSWSWAYHYDSYRGTSDNILNFAFICVAGLTAVGLVTKQDSPYFLLSVLGGASQLAWQRLMTDFDDPKSRLSAFISNGTCFGPIVWSGLLINYLNAVATAEYI